MSKIKNLFLELSEKIKQVTKKYPITMAIILILTAITSICLDDFLIDWYTLSDILFVGIIWGIGVLFSESFFKEKKVVKVRFDYSYFYNSNVFPKIYK